VGPKLDCQLYRLIENGGRHGKLLGAIGLNVLTRCIETILRRPPTTTLTPSFVRWRRVLSPDRLLVPVMTITFRSIFLFMVLSVFGFATVVSRFKRPRAPQMVTEYRGV
jgi:hypothetical protein